MIEPVVERNLAKIAVIGVGGAGNNAINHMIEAKLENVEFFAINTDLQALSMNLAENRIQIGAQITGGLGSGGNPDLGRKACEESLDLIKDILTGYDLIFLACGEGGGTGTGATPLIAEVAKAQGAIVVAVVTKPFEFEGKNRMQQALQGIEQLKSKVDTLIVIPNQKLILNYGQISCFQAFRLADDVLLNAVKGISDLITQPGIINIDFADVRNVMLQKGGALISTGIA
ncbi:MAG: cell division protein FtsZ, partial [candidate division WOR-3 bacterium]|nr:cell division protein FtsZ [candidate division WOR-3 bacterium]